MVEVEVLREAEGSPVRRLQRRRVRQDRREVNQLDGWSVMFVEGGGRARAYVGTQSRPAVSEKIFTDKFELCRRIEFDANSVYAKFLWRTILLWPLDSHI